MTTNLPHNETPAINGSAFASTQQKTFEERGCLLLSVTFSIRDKHGNLSDRLFMIPTDLQLRSGYEQLYSDTLKNLPLMRALMGDARYGHFVLVNRDGQLAGCTTLDMSEFSDRDIAWLNCILAESEGAILGFVGSVPSIH